MPCGYACKRNGAEATCHPKPQKQRFSSVNSVPSVVKTAFPSLVFSTPRHYFRCWVTGLPRIIFFSTNGEVMARTRAL